jgi:hypothetical protein
MREAAVHHALEDYENASSCAEALERSLEYPPAQGVAWDEWLALDNDHVREASHPARSCGASWRSAAFTNDEVRRLLAGADPALLLRVGDLREQKLAVRA